ncbi:uncharacterized protein LOC132544438 [Ylistrum balloti]|uniref:uncharacterized protein LOC132544438 n=1 Tax=Ylistrum balloti TaxID=509963 RepID=UPI002905A83B|nr:uncharacterized protein LOC132544438 [Ylistrum balloti]XP_060064019.1 uncharacterized protein LOC132544438 [Ylistrum balloti]XP_060064020.1 uncharacterized protein LOC132544438 [Ylistrum balloti]XP_060064021.1 uncharacterized protein LOC132544438 [Ylistrum balloti]
MDSNNLWKMLVGVAFSLMVVGAQDQIESVIRLNNTLCPQNAVCANVFRYDEPVGPYVARSILHCNCNNFDENGGCPYLTPNEDNSLYQSQRNREVICGSVRTMSECREGQIARERKSDRKGRNYFVVYCRCPEHTRPYNLVNRLKATVSLRMFKTQYRCNIL